MGSIQPYKTRSPKHKQAYTYTVASQNAFHFIESVAPYLVIKQKQAAIVQELASLVKNTIRIS